MNTKRGALDRAAKLLGAGRLRACQRELRAMEPEARDCEEYHTTWLSTLILRKQWKEAESYAGPLVEKHGRYCSIFYNGLISGLCGQDKVSEALTVTREARSHWPDDRLFREIEGALVERCEGR